MAEVDTYPRPPLDMARGSHARCSGTALGGGFPAPTPFTLRGVSDAALAYQAAPPKSEGKDSAFSGRRRGHGGRTPKKRQRTSPKKGSPEGGSPKGGGSPTTSEGENSLRGSGSHGPPIPAEIAPASARAAVSKDVRAFTRDGCPRLAELVGQDVEVWSGRRWIRVRVAVAPAATEFYRVRLDDGTCLDCTADHPWAVVADGRLVPVRARDLRTDLAVSPFLLFTPEDLGGAEVPQAYEMGAALGRRLAKSCKPKDGTPARVFSMDPASLGQFVAGWMDAQQGTLFGCYAAIHDLQVALRRLGVYHTFAEDLGTYYALGLSQEDASRIPNPKGGPREYRRAVSDLPRVTEVCLMNGRQKAYTITSDDPKARTVVLNGVLTLC